MNLLIRKWETVAETISTLSQQYTRDVEALAVLRSESMPSSQNRDASVALLQWRLDRVSTLSGLRVCDDL